MAQVEFKTHRVGRECLHHFTAGLLRAAGFTRQDAELASEILIHANLRGIDSHGIARLPHYLDRIEAGSINPCPEMKLEHLAPAAARIDGDHGLGHLVTYQATEQAIILARQAGAGWVSINHSSHCGALAYYGLKIAEAGMIGLVFTHVDPMVIPYGASEPFCGTNPICITAPGQSGDSLCLDMATSVTPWNSVMNAAMEGVPIPKGWAVNDQGHDTTDPNEVAAVYPFGEYKGSGLGLLIDVMCALLSDSPYGPDIPKMYGDLSQKRQLGGLVGAIDIRSFTSLSNFHHRLTQLMKRWNLLRPAPQYGRVLYPGEPERMEHQRRLQEGIPLGRSLINTFDILAGQYGLPPISAG